MIQHLKQYDVTLKCITQSRVSVQVATGELRAVRFGVIFNFKTSVSEKGLSPNPSNRPGYALANGGSWVAALAFLIIIA